MATKPTIQSVQSWILDMHQKVFNGETEALPLYIELHSLSETLEDVMAGIKSTALEEARRRKGQTFMGVEIGYAEGKRSFDFSLIEPIQKVQEQLQELKERHKNAALQVEKGLLAVDKDTGELIQPAVVKYGEPSIVLKRPKNPNTR